jgi:hypothetical protein
MDGKLIVSLVAFGLLYLICLIVGYYIIRWIFNINRRMRKQDVMIDLLFVLAERSGASKEELERIRKQYHKSFKESLDY